MDPLSQSFNPYSTNTDTWRLQGELSKLQQVQAEHADRIAKLERRHDEDARMKSVWGSSSPFPSVLSGTPQQAPVQQPPVDQFRNFDDDTNNLISSLHLDAEEEPRRSMGAASRANSVRFDESANQNHFSHLTRPSFDYLARNGSALGGLALGERSASHKSDGRASSAHSIRSTASGRANSLNLDTTYGLSDSSQEIPTLAPGLAFLGSVPAIIRCWMNTNFKHDALLYAAVCTGSYKSFLALDLIQKLGFEELIVSSTDGTRTIELPVYFPEAVPHPASSRSSSPASQLPSLTAAFEVVGKQSSDESRAIQIILGSDTLRSHSADILFSSSNLTLFDDERSKLSIPLVRPENEATFNTLRTSDANLRTMPLSQEAYANGCSEHNAAAAESMPTPPAKYRAPIGFNVDSAASSDSASRLSEHEVRPTSRGSAASRPSLSIGSRAEAGDDQTTGGSHRSASGSVGVWSNWRREGVTPTSAGLQTPMTASSLDWGKNRDAAYQRKDTGIKVLKPKSTSRAPSTSAATTPSTPSIESKSSRFFDEGRRKSGNADVEKKDTAQASSAQVAQGVQSKTRSNPIGGASAFSWLTPSGGSK